MCPHLFIQPNFAYLVQYHCVCVTVPVLIFNTFGKLFDLTSALKAFLRYWWWFINFFEYLNIGTLCTSLSFIWTSWWERSTFVFDQFLGRDVRQRYWWQTPSVVNLQSDRHGLFHNNFSHFLSVVVFWRNQNREVKKSGPSAFGVNPPEIRFKTWFFQFLYLHWSYSKF